MSKNYSIKNIILITIFVTGCVPPKYVQQQVDYSPVFVPQESGYRFYKISDDADGINITLANESISYGDIRDKVFDISRAEDKMIFQSISKTGANIFLRPLNNLRLKQQRTFQDWAWDCTLSPDGKLLAYCANKNGSTNIFMIDAEQGSKIQQITNTNSFSYNPVFFPDGSKLLFSVSEQVGQQYSSSQGKYVPIYDDFIWSYDLEKGSLIQYGKGYNADFFSNEQYMVVVVRIIKDFPELWLFELESGKEYSLLADENNGFVQPSVSPNGDKIAYASISYDNNTQSNFDIFVINADGSKRTQITFHPGNDYCPRWSKDGKSLYFVSQRGNSTGIYNVWKINMY